MKYKRILLKLSGESLQGAAGYGIDPGQLKHYATEIRSVTDLGVQVGIVLGGGNIFRGAEGQDEGLERVTGDYMGMLATIINSMALQAELAKQGMRAKILSAIAIDPVCERMSRRRAISHLEHGCVVLMAGGTGNPYFTTDSAAALRAVETGADILLKGTRVDGIYSADPEKDPNATRYEKLTFTEAIDRKLRIMDLTAFTLCQENGLPVMVFDVNKAGNLLRIVNGENIGTLVSKGEIF